MRQHRPFYDLLSPRQKATIQSRIPALGKDECHPWRGWMGVHGYGGYSLGARFGVATIVAHRAVWAVANGRDPGALCVLHRCNNKSCVNPAHLYLGTDTDNYVDRVAANSNGIAPYIFTRDNAPKRKLSTDDVREIKRLLASGSKHHNVAIAFGISRPHVSRIKRGRQWGDIVV